MPSTLAAKPAEFGLSGQRFVGWGLFAFLPPPYSEF